MGPCQKANKNLIIEEKFFMKLRQSVREYLFLSYSRSSPMVAICEVHFVKLRIQPLSNEV